MKKFFTLIAAAMMAVAVSAEELISFQATADAQELPASIAISGTTVKAAAKYKTNSVSMNCLQLKNGYTTDAKFNGNAIILSVDGGFKAGDVVTIAGYINAKEEDNKRATAVLFTLNDDNSTNKLHQFGDFVNGRLVDDDPVEDSFTLEADADKLYLGRDGGTGANLYTIKVTRSADAVDAVQADNKAAKKVSKVVKNGKVVIVSENGTVDAAGAQQ